MAYRPIQTSIHNDPYILDLQRDYKYFFLYLLTNDNTTQSGIYEIPLKKIELETDFSGEQLFNMLHKFQGDGKIKYSMETREICIINWLKYNENTSPKTMERVRKELVKVKNPHLVLLLYDPRRPLLDKTYKKKGEDTETHILIENPWKEYFKELTDEDLREIRGIDAKYGVSIPLPYPIDTPSAITEQTHIQNITETETETEHAVWSLDDLIKMIDFWNDSKYGLPKYPKSKYKTGVNIPDIHDLLKNLSFFTREQISQSIINYSKILNDNSYKAFPTYPTAISFLIKGIESYYDDAKPFERCLKSGEIKKKKIDDKRQKNMPSHCKQCETEINEKNTKISISTMQCRECKTIYKWNGHEWIIDK